MRFPAELFIASVLLASCAVVPASRDGRAGRDVAPRTPVSDAMTKVGSAYTVGGRRYVPSDDRQFEQTGLASWYGEELRGRPTASGERFDPDGISAAHRTLPMPSYVEVTDLDSGRTILVRINDRGPFHGNRIIDLSLGAARQLGITGRGSHRVAIRRVDADERDKQTLRRGDSVALRDGPRRRDLTALRENAGFVAASPQVTPSGDGPFFVQIASFSSKSRARKLADRLDADIDEAADIYRVRLGPYRNARAASAALARLEASGYPGALITR